VLTTRDFCSSGVALPQPAQRILRFSSCSREGGEEGAGREREEESGGEEEGF
jgi:hypothetical protein